MVQDVLKKVNAVSFVHITDDKTGDTVLHIPAWVIAVVAIVIFSLIRLRRALS
ncbi:hypothetical protein [Dictyobacter kobayashii]|uniref:Uncharacterized protein n=1 Tax=Dictyobacter kobayashii TaxID=2014872 RepID=A0A402AHF7_9CHLR|nr:hypothetical protein [Dictyobacter kobayashii]GCE18495.1 hypothetical protein KDK_22950 [Dictyobacter kobayashii]